MTKIYETDITEEQFGRIEKMLEHRKKKTSPRHLDLRQVFNGIIYLLRTGSQWRQLPKEYPKWSSVYYYFRKWSEKKEGRPSILDAVLKKISR